MYLQQVWWNCDVIVIGENGLRKTHPVLKFLQDEGRVASLAYFRHGIDAFQQAYPFLVGQSLKAHRNLVYPSPVKGIKGLYLGNWKNAEDTENLKQLGITRLVTIHNDPQALKFPGTSLARNSADYFICLHAFSKLNFVVVLLWTNARHHFCPPIAFSSVSHGAWQPMYTAILKETLYLSSQLLSIVLAESVAYPNISTRRLGAPQTMHLYQRLQ
jgi:hypothetical protein